MEKAKRRRPPSNEEHERELARQIRTGKRILGQDTSQLSDEDLLMEYREARMRDTERRRLRQRDQEREGRDIMRKEKR
ncbi:MAG: hypothetical protein GF416_01940 [Candidatus Altiarchaeales archaeon]|nr:hypothetical protein [Candidatus Altiarchaeales archaeon]MBD3415878.1 hypothetical protein [Candidatus Altiarchaeales archaeon]